MRAGFVIVKDTCGFSRQYWTGTNDVTFRWSRDYAHAAIFDKRSDAEYDLKYIVKDDKARVVPTIRA